MGIATQPTTTGLPTLEALLLTRQVEEFLIHLQNVIDEHRYPEWVELFVAEGVYSVIDHQNANDQGMYLIYDDGLEARKERMAYLMGYWKVPRARTLHTNS